MKRGVWRIFGVILLAGAILRFVDLGRRPLHGDEAVGASLSLDVLQTGSHTYESANRHGPFQYYLGGAAMALLGPSDGAIRFPYALAGCLLPLALVGFRRHLTDPGWLLASGLIAFSPAFLYYSRYAIQEIHFALVTATFLAAGLAFASRGAGRSLVGLFLAAGWMITLKETFVIVWGCLALSVFLGALLGGPPFRSALREAGSSLKRRWIVALGGAGGGTLLVAAAYTDGFRDSAGLRNLARNLAEMMRLGASSPAGLELHRHPPGFYLSLLARYEWPILLLAAAGLWAAYRSRRPFPLLLALDALLLSAVHLALPYKTPWLLLTPLLPLALLGGYGGAALLDRNWKHRKWTQASARGHLLAATLVPFLCLPQSISLCFFRPADPTESMVYHPTGPDQATLVREIRTLASRLPADLSPKVLVALPYAWPLGWYLRDRSDVLYERSPVPLQSPQELSRIPIILTLERADRRFLLTFTGSERIPPFSLPGYRSRTYVLIPPDYNVARLHVRSDLVPARPSE